MILNREILKEAIQMANKYGKKLFDVFSPKRNAYKTSVRLHTTSIKMAIVQNKTTKQAVQPVHRPIPERNLVLLPIDDIAALPGLASTLQSAAAQAGEFPRTLPPIAVLTFSGLAGILQLVHQPSQVSDPSAP